MRHVLLCVCLLLWPSSVLAATKYIDFAGGSDSNSGDSTAAAWKRAPGMAGVTGVAASYTPTAGDVFTFKGGVSWTAFYPWTLQGGTASNPVSYTVDQTWFTGAAFSQPTFDCQHSAPNSAVGCINAANENGLTINNMRFIDAGTGGKVVSTRYMVIDSTSNFKLTNNTFATESPESVLIRGMSPGTYSNYTITGNDFSRMGSAIWWITAQTNTHYTNVDYNNNTFHDGTSQIGGGIHGDGALHWFGVGADANQSMTNFRFCNNTFYGDWRRSFGTTGAMTAFFFVEGTFNGTICNNVFSFAPAQASQFEGLISIGGSIGCGAGSARAVNIYGNTFVHPTGPNSMSAAIVYQACSAPISVKNNILTGMQYPFYAVDNTALWDSNYNLINGTSGQLVMGSAFQSYATWRGHDDANSVFGVAPGFVSTTDFHLQSTSPAIGVGTNLSSLGIPILNADRVGVARGSAWDIGAYEFGTGPPPPPPPPPPPVVVTSYELQYALPGAPVQLVTVPASAAVCGPNQTGVTLNPTRIVFDDPVDPANRDCSIDQAAFIDALPDGTYTVTVTPLNGTVRGPSSAPATFTRLRPVAPCVFTVAPLTVAVPSTASTGTITVTTTAACAWTATSSATWLTVTAGGSGTGSGTVTYSAAANVPTTSRVATLTVGGVTVTVTQAGAAPPVPVPAMLLNVRAIR